LVDTPRRQLGFVGLLSFVGFFLACCWSSLVTVKEPDNNNNKKQRRVKHAPLFSLPLQGKATVCLPLDNGTSLLGDFES
jgi:hypothetical protein